MKKKLVSMVYVMAMALSMITGCGESRQPAASAQPQEAARDGIGQERRKWEIQGIPDGGCV